MKINIRKVGNMLVEVVIKHYGLMINLGLMNKDERIELAEIFQEASDELLSGLDRAAG